MQRFQILLYPAPDLPQQWLGHCIELDLVSQGNGPVEAMEMVIEAMDLLAKDNLAAGRPEFEFRAAPPEVTEMCARAEQLVS